MNELLERIKSLDKKILVGVGIAVAVVIILIIALIVSLGNNKETGNKGDSQNNTQYGTETEGGVTEVFGTEQATEILGTEMTTETEMATENESSEATSESGQSQTGAVNPDGEEILGAGNSSDPYLEILGDDKTVKTVSIAPGTTAYYGIYRVGGMYLTINDANAYVIYEGKRYDASNGKVSLKVQNELASEAVYFEIGNKGSTATSFTLSFSNPSGTYANPEKIATMGQYQISLAKGNEVGHYYKYTAEKSGTIRFYISASVECEMSVTNNNTSHNRTFESDVITDEQGQQYIELAVSQGDVIMIQVYAKPDKRWNYPAADITWSGIYQ